MGMLNNHTGHDTYFRQYGRPAAFAQPTRDVSVLEVAGLCVPPGEIYPAQKSYFCTAAWCVGGGITFHGRGWQLPVRENQVGVIDAGVNFRVDAGENGARVYYLLVDGPTCNTLLHTSGLWQGVFNFREAPVGWLEKIAEGISSRELQTITAHNGHNMFMQIAHQARESCPDPLIWDAAAYFQQHIGDPDCNIESALAHLQVSHTKLANLFKEHLHKKPSQYLSDIRLELARRLLLESNQQVAGIARACGHPDASYFSQWFKKLTGKSPSQARTWP